MPAITYKDLHNDEWEHVVRAHYKDEVKQAQSLGFHEAYYVSETVSPLMLLNTIHGFFIHRFINHELCWINGNLQGVMAYPFLIHEEGYAFATCLKRGITYTTLLEDGTALDTTSHFTLIYSNPQHRYTRQRCKTGRADAWQLHKTTVAQLVSENRAVVPVVSLQDALHIGKYVDEIIISGKTSGWQEKVQNKANHDTD